MITIGSEADLDGIRRTMWLAGVIDSWAERGLFDELASQTECRLRELPGDERALRITARILANAGLLVRRGEQWALSATGARLHEEGALGDERPMRWLRDLSRLDSVLSDGGPVMDDEGEQKVSDIGVHRGEPEKTRQFLEMLYRRSATSARQTAHWIDDTIDDNSRVLDLGGGHGRYGRELVEAGHQTTLFDFPVSVDVARNLHGEQLDYIEGDFFSDDLGGPYDVVLASNIVHGLSQDQNKTLLKRISKVLNPGGVVVLKDMFLDEFGLWPDRAAYFGLLMLMYTDRGDSYSLKEAHRWLEEAGLIVREPVVFEGFSLVVGQRPK